MTLLQLRCLVAIVDSRCNISLAAQQLHLTQPAISRHLKQLEHELGFQLFTRRGRALVSPTPGGEEILPLARRILLDAAQLRGYAAQRRGDGGGELVIAAVQTYARHVLPPLLTELHRRYPALSLRLQPLGEGVTLDRQASDACDLSLVSTAGNATPRGVAVPMFRWPRVLLVPHGHALAQRGGIAALSDLAASPLVTYEASRRPASSLVRTLAAAGLAPRFACSTHDADLIKTYVRAGMGIGLLSELAVEDCDRNEFSVLTVDPALPDCIAWAVLGEGRVLRECTLDLLRLLAPQIDAADVRRALRGEPPQAWPEPPRWRRPGVGVRAVPTALSARQVA